ncbi:MAG: hypothetical protein GY743_23655, partial [Planctomycetaceae bacterium]|nr:hypothetical protein [Planctomycetaceae bacterium]
MTETKEISEATETEDKMRMPHSAMYSIPGATSFAELDAVEEAQETATKIKRRARQFTGLVENILVDPEIEDKSDAIGRLGNEFSTVAGEAIKEREAPHLEAKNSFLVYKEADGGYRWLAIYSNKFRDRDNPPEIISEASHIRFVKEVNAGNVPYPELWLWHANGSRWGEADFVGYDDNGFAVATGTVDKGREWVAEALRDDLLTSHGMPHYSIERDADDPTIITRHITKEISPLPANVAANEFTGFNILDEVKQMALQEQDKAKLTELGVDPEKFEAETEAKAKETEGLEFKEAETPEAEQPEAGAFVSRDEVSELVKSVAESTKQLVTVVGDLAERVKSLEVDKEIIEKETLERTPGASLSDLYKSVIGSPEAKVDGR